MRVKISDILAGIWFVILMSLVLSFGLALGG